VNDNLTQELLRGLQQLCPLAGDMRFGQILATLGMLGEDMVGRSLWEIADNELLEVVERFRQDLDRRVTNVA